MSAASSPSPTRTSRFLRSKLTWAAAGVGAVVVAAGLVAFEPWALWIDNTVVEAAPTAPLAVAAPADARAPMAAAEAPSGSPAWPVTEYTGEFVSHEHATSGTVRILRFGDGSRVLRLEDLDTSNGPDLKVLFSDAAVQPGKDGWHVFDDNRHVKLAGLKGNKGSQNYDIPADVDPSDFRSVAIWCDRFNVSFGATELHPAAA